jgi:hypothetical protein
MTELLENAFLLNLAIRVTCEDREKTKITF